MRIFGFLPNENVRFLSYTRQRNYLWIDTTLDIILRPLFFRYLNILFGVVSIAQLVEVTDSAVLGSVAEVVSSNPTVYIYI